jgi:chemosensory pili system protein ChpA (sensor histidine kinase/response regulator)
MRQPDNEEINCRRDNAVPHAAESLRMTQSPPLVPQATKVLIVDDDPVVRSLMQDALEDDGYAVVEAADGVEALQRCQEEVPLLVIVDAVMPNMDGFHQSSAHSHGHRA